MAGCHALGDSLSEGRAAEVGGSSLTEAQVTEHARQVGEWNRLNSAGGRPFAVRKPAVFNSLLVAPAAEQKCLHTDLPGTYPVGPVAIAHVQGVRGLSVKGGERGMENFGMRLHRASPARVNDEIEKWKEIECEKNVIQPRIEVRNHGDGEAGCLQLTDNPSGFRVGGPPLRARELGEQIIEDGLENLV